MSNKNKPIPREVAPQWAKGMKVLHHALFKPSWWQRVQIALGGNILLTSQMFTTHKPGRTAGGIFPRITSATDAKDPKLAMVLKVEAEKALVMALPTSEQFAASESLQEAWQKLVKERVDSFVKPAESTENKPTESL